MCQDYNLKYFKTMKKLILIAVYLFGLMAYSQNPEKLDYSIKSKNVATEASATPDVAVWDSNKILKKIAWSNLPGGTPEVLEYANYASFPATGVIAKIYVDKATNVLYRWSGSDYVILSPFDLSSYVPFEGDPTDKSVILKNIQVGTGDVKSRIILATDNVSTEVSTDDSTAPFIKNKVSSTSTEFTEVKQTQNNFRIFNQQFPDDLFSIDFPSQRVKLGNVDAWFTVDGVDGLKSFTNGGLNFSSINLPSGYFGADGTGRFYLGDYFGDQNSNVITVDVTGYGNINLQSQFLTSNGNSLITLFKNSSFTAKNGEEYIITTGTPTITDPTGVDITGATVKGYKVYVTSGFGGTATIDGVTYPQGSLIYRYYDGGWSSKNFGGSSSATNLTNTPEPTKITVNSSTGSGTDLPLADSTNAGLESPAQFLKLAGIAAGATANSSDATLLNRTNHTGTQPASTVSDFNSAALLAAPAETTSTLGAIITGASAATPNNTDLVATVESSVAKKITWTNVKAFLKIYFDTLYPSGSGTSSGANSGDSAVNSLYSGLASSKEDVANKIIGTLTNSTISYPASSLVKSVTDANAANIASNAANIASNTTAIGTKEPSITAGTTSQYWRGDKTWQTLNKTAVGVPNIDNTSDVNKPVSTAQQTALDLKMTKTANLSDLSSVQTAKANLNIDKRTTFGDANYTILITDAEVVTSVTFTAPRTVTLPTGENAGQEFVIADEFQTVTSANTLTIAVASGKKLNGVTNGTELIGTAGAWRRLKADGSGNYSFDAGIMRVSNYIGTTLTASKAVVTDSNGKLAPSATTATEIGYSSGVTSPIQTQLDNSFYKSILKDNAFWFSPNALASASSFNYSSYINSHTFTVSGNTSGTKGMALFNTTATAGTIAFSRRHDGLILTGFACKITRKIQFQTNISGQRFFCGFTKGNQFSAPTNVDQTTLTDIVGVAQLSSSTNMQVIYNDNTGTATTIDLGSSYPCNDTQYNYFITIEQTTSSYIATVERVTVATGASISVSNTLSTNIPVYSTGVIQLCTWISNNATASIASYLDGGGYGKFNN